jgi:hypothetical protein
MVSFQRLSFLLHRPVFSYEMVEFLVFAFNFRVYHLSLDLVIFLLLSLKIEMVKLNVEGGLLGVLSDILGAIRKRNSGNRRRGKNVGLCVLRLLVVGCDIPFF